MSKPSQTAAPPAADASTKERMCFVIGPIGDPDSPERIEADWVLLGIVKPVLEDPEFGYRVIRADQVSEPGMITDQVITHVMEDALVVADMTGRNANAFYELAIRHMEERPTIHIIKAGEPLPFDVKDYRAITYKRTHPNDLEIAKKELRDQVRAVQKSGYQTHNPVTRARGHRELARSADSKDRMLAEVLASKCPHDGSHKYGQR